jgi:hypothetical protein
VGFHPVGPSSSAIRVARRSLRSHASRASSEQDQIGSRRTGAVHHVSPRGITLDVHYPDPLGSDTFCRELVELPAGEADTSGRSRAVPELTLDFAVYRGPAFARSAAARSAFAGRWPESPPLTLPREEDRNLRSPRCLPSVRSTSDGGREPRPVDPAKHTTARRVDLYPQVVPNLWIRVRAFFIPRRSPR